MVNVAVVAMASMPGLVGGGCAARSGMRAAYERVELGRAMPRELGLPAAATVEERGDVWRAVVRPKDGELYDGEGIAVVRGEEGRVVARHYWRYDEQVMALLLLMTARGDYAWEMSRARLAAATTQEAGSNDALLSALAAEGERLGGKWTALKAGIRAAKADPARETQPLDVTARSNRSQLGYSEASEFRFAETENAIRVTGNENYDASMLVWTASGWRKMLTNGGKLESGAHGSASGSP